MNPDSPEVSEETTLPLRGVRILDIATLLAAPSAATYLGEFGADVIKVEQPGLGDHQRHFGSRRDGWPLMWMSLSRNKRSLTLDLRKLRGAELFKRLAATADVIIENFRPGTLERWNLSPDCLLELNPKLIILRVSGYGQTGPYASRPGFGTLAEALSGFAHLVGEHDGPPTLPSFPLADGIAGLTGAYAILIALYDRARHDGRGQVIDISLFEPLLRLLEPFMLDYDQLAIAASRIGNRSDHISPRNAYRCLDGKWVALSASAQSIFERLAAAIGRAELAVDPRFRDSASRIQHSDEIDAIVAAWFESRTSGEALETMETFEVTVGAIYDIPQIFADPHVQARETFTQAEDEQLGTVRVANVVPRFSRTPGSVRTTGPRLGQHNAEILEELGVDAAELASLQSEGIV